MKRLDTLLTRAFLVHASRKPLPLSAEERDIQCQTCAARRSDAGELAARLRALRLERGLTVDQVAERLLCSPSKVSRMETGQRGATLRDVRDLCGIYGLTDPSQVEYLMGLVREAKQQAWWQSYDLDYYATYVGLEQAAVTLVLLPVNHRPRAIADREIRAGNARGQHAWPSSRRKEPAN